MSANSESLEGAEKVSNTTTFALEQCFNSRDIATMKERAHNILILLYPYMNDHERLMWKAEQKELFAEFVLIAHIIKRTGIIDQKQRSHIYAVLISRIYDTTPELAQIYSRILNCMMSAYMSDEELELFGAIGTATHRNLTLAFKVMRHSGFLIGRV